MTKPKQLYGAMINLVGLYHDKPLKLRFNKELQAWWTSDGNVDFPGPGLENKWRTIKFASKNKREVELFISGARSITAFLKSFAGN